MKKIAVLVDSSADITNEEAKTLGLEVIRMPLTINGEDVMETDGISDKDFIQKMKDGATVKTSQPLLGNLVFKWKELLETYDGVLFLPISSRLSGTYNSAVLASKEFDGKVVVVDAKMACCPVQAIAIDAKNMAEKGYSLEEIKNKIENETYMFACIIPETLTYLKNGGRISPAAAALGNLLKIIPILKVEDGYIDVSDKVRTTKKAYMAGIEKTVNVDNPEDYYWFVVHSDCEELAKEYKAVVEEKTHQEVQIKPIRAIIMAHTGPGTLGVCRVKKIKY
ncbi:DegV family protein [Anaerorhabdus sp.]|jgi:DegV family protein with EDD domain|uniref:DegV family protein n=2 Tax=Anaerorhabdus sp. TaxID=1872524 RepID=UPI002FC678E8